jgi:uncharacterized RDD family membrane protein YckC
MEKEMQNRIIAGLIDGVIAGVALSILLNIIPVIGLLLGYVVYFGYYAYFNKTTGVTLGKQVMGLRVVGNNGEVSWQDAIIRALTFWFGWIGFFVNPDKRGFHEMWSNTHVVAEKKKD